MACLGTATAHATDVKSGELSEKQGDLKELRGKIANLRKELNANEGNRASAAERLKAAERAI
ncbi:MAG: peptidase M23, partial [Azonexus sp.]|nr:peptidase M23 [Azonexus sp.]